MLHSPIVSQHINVYNNLNRQIYFVLYKYILKRSNLIVCVHILSTSSADSFFVLSTIIQYLYTLIQYTIFYTCALRFPVQVFQFEISSFCYESTSISNNFFFVLTPKRINGAQHRIRNQRQVCKKHYIKFNLINIIRSLISNCIYICVKR